MSLMPAGSISLNMQGVRELFAHSAVWQEWTTASTAGDTTAKAQAARRRVHYYGPPPPGSPSEGYSRDELETLRPFVVLTLRPPEFLRSSRAFFRSRRDGSSYLNSYLCFAYLCADVPDVYRDNPPLAYLWFQNLVGRLIDDLWLVTFSDVADLAYLQGIDLASEPSRSKLTYNATQGDFIEALLQIDSGVGGW